MTCIPPTTQPAGAEATQGISVADGTDWAMRIITLLVSQLGSAYTPMSWAGVNIPLTAETAQDQPQQQTEGEGDPLDAPALQHDRLARWRQAAKDGQHVAGVLLHERPQLCRAGHSSGGGERLGELIRSEVPQRSLVHPLGSVRTASTSIMFPRSTACRHGDGRTWAKATSISRLRRRAPGGCPA